MSKAHRVRLLIDFAGMAVALGIMFSLQAFWLGLCAAVIVFVVTHALAEKAFTAMASRDEIKADLEDRKNNSD